MNDFFWNEVDLCITFMQKKDSDYIKFWCNSCDNYSNKYYTYHIFSAYSTAAQFVYLQRLLNRPFYKKLYNFLLRGVL